MSQLSEHHCYQQKILKIPDGIMTLNIFELPKQPQQGNSYESFVNNLKSRLIDVCVENPWLLGRLEQTRSISLTSPLNGDFDLLTPHDLSRKDIEKRLLQDDGIFVEAPKDLPWATIEGSPLLDLARLVQLAGACSNEATSTINMMNQLSGRTYQDLSKLLKRAGCSTAIGTGPELAKTSSALFKVVVLPTPNKSHAFVIVTLSHAIADGNTYHRIVHMLFQSTDRKTNQEVPITKMTSSVQDLPPSATTASGESIVDNIEAITKRYKKERDAVVPEAKLLDQIKLGLDIGRSAIKQQLQPEDRALQSFVALINQDEVNWIKKEYTTNKEYREAVFGDDESTGDDNSNNKRKLVLSTNDVLVCELSKLLNVDRMDTNMDVRIKVLSERMGIPQDIAANSAGNFVAMLPFKRQHFTNPWYIRQAMTRDDNTFYADPVENNSKDSSSNITGNLSNWSGFTVGTQLGGGGCGGAKLVLHLPINVTASGNTPFEQALVFCPFQDQPKQLAVIISTHRYQKLLDRIEQQEQQKLLIPFCVV